MFDRNDNSLLSLKQAVSILPQRAAGRPFRVAVLYRWLHAGVYGIRLEGCRVGGRWYTSQAALQRFFDALGSGSKQVDPTQT